MKQENQDPKLSFSNPAMVANYSIETPRRVPGLADLHRMSMLLLSEQTPAAAKILVLGAGGGLELKAMAEAQPLWTFLGIDPSAEMLELARRNIDPFKHRVDLLHDYIEGAPPGPFDAATCLLTLHFLERQDRLRTLREIHRRLRPLASLVVMHHSCPEDGDVERWLSRSVAFADRTGIDPAKAAASAASMAKMLPLLSASADEALLYEAGFSSVSLFYAAFSFRGWVATVGAR